MKTSAPDIVAHRGASSEAPENTLAAFLLAWRQGADGVEGDFRLTGDGEVVCIHDRTTERVAGAEMVIAETDYSRLRTLDVGAWKGRKWLGERIPTLREVLTTVPERKKVFVEIKSGLEIFPRLQAIVAGSGLSASQVVFISFSTEVIAETKRRFPGYKALWIVELYEGSKRVLPLFSLPDALQTLASIGADGLDLQAHETVEPALVQAVVESGFEFHLWSEGETAELERFAGLPVASITTNFPGPMKAIAAASALRAKR